MIKEKKRREVKLEEVVRSKIDLQTNFDELAEKY